MDDFDAEVDRFFKIYNSEEEAISAESGSGTAARAQ